VQLMCESSHPPHRHSQICDRLSYSEGDITDVSYVVNKLNVYQNSDFISNKFLEHNLFSLEKIMRSGVRR
jgi:hypothetical protein